MVGKQRTHDTEEVSETTTGASAVATVATIPSEGQLRTIESWDDALSLMAEVTGGDVREVRDEVGDGFDFLEDKDRLIGIPLLFVRWEPGRSQSFTDDDGEPLRTVQCWVVAQRGNGTVRKYRFVDFSTGVCQQLYDYTERSGRRAGLLAPYGLRKSEFTYHSPSGEQSLAATYYIDLRTES